MESKAPIFIPLTLSHLVSVFLSIPYTKKKLVKFPQRNYVHDCSLGSVKEKFYSFVT